MFGIELEFCNSPSSQLACNFHHLLRESNLCDVALSLRRARHFSRNLVSTIQVKTLFGSLDPVGRYTKFCWNGLWVRLRFYVLCVTARLNKKVAESVCHPLLALGLESWPSWRKLKESIDLNRIIATSVSFALFCNRFWTCEECEKR